MVGDIQVFFVNISGGIEQPLALYTETFINWDWRAQLMKKGLDNSIRQM